MNVLLAVIILKQCSNCLFPPKPLKPSPSGFGEVDGSGELMLAKLLDLPILGLAPGTGASTSSTSKIRPSGICRCTFWSCTSPELYIHRYEKKSMQTHHMAFGIAQPLTAQSKPSLPPILPLALFRQIPTNDDLIRIRMLHKRYSRFSVSSRRYIKLVLIIFILVFGRRSDRLTVGNGAKRHFPS